MFLFLACGVVITGRIYLVCIGVLVLFRVVCEYGPKLYSKSKERLEKYLKSSMETDIEGQNARGVPSQSDDSQTRGVKNGEGARPRRSLEVNLYKKWECVCFELLYNYFSFISLSFFSTSLTLLQANPATAQLACSFLSLSR